MNGRLYDPLLRRFLNADENIQDMFNTQNYNKYGYVMNNPLMYNDPSGEIIPFIAAAVAWIVSNAAAIATAAAIGAAVGLAAYTVGVLVTGSKWSLVAALKATFWGGISGAVTFGIGSIFSSAAQTFGNAILQAAAHGVAQGTLSLMQGASFKQAFIAGALGSLGASAWGYALNKVGLSQFASSTVGTVAFGALSGGIGAELSGGNFWQGALIGGIVAGLNHAMHEIDPPKGFKGKKWIDSTGEYENNFDGSYKATGPNGEKYTLLEEVELSSNKYSKLLDEAANGIGISSDLKESAFNYAKKLGNDLTNTKYFKYGVKGLGKVTGIYGAYSSTRDFIYKPSWQSGTKAALSILSVTKYVNPTVGLILGISDVTGFTDWTLNKIYGK
ncbi:hypothetical protein EIH08_07850 [Chryseobacterium taklimakanense]|uniref:RHS repeat-associated core domain-containing protein n=1 Tax=Chryseobacterium taklimakanense TaxID=536441 RepID=A0A3G8WYN7_9FLAO|nr:RHS repeat-associated core domain-containing protein [Chryseobacterium taklimakanense]AZI21441.1 hypothetical protein EIH08_07850 [Chryseobacterium taklimakanense]